MVTEDLFWGWASIPMDSLVKRQSTHLPKESSLAVNESPTPGETSKASICSKGAGRDLESYAPFPVDAHVGRSSSGVAESLRHEIADESTKSKRRGHTKSKLGCISCKKRKVKCQETWPSCANCIKRGCPCRYPTVFRYTQHDRVVSEVLSSPGPYVQLSDKSMPPTYTANDMRLFHHFLVAAHPCNPLALEHEIVWVRDVPKFGHQYTYLMHAMLALSGSHLDLFVDDPRPNRSLTHRQKAIEGLEEAFTRWPPTPSEAHVMLATSYLLAFQSSYMFDGMMEHILSLRGCAMLSQTIFTNGFEGVFSVNPNLHGHWFEGKMKNFPAFDQQLIREALHSFANFAPHLAASPKHGVERDILAQLVECLRCLLLPLEPSEKKEDSPLPTPVPTGSFSQSMNTEAQSSESPTSDIPSSDRTSLVALASRYDPDGSLKNPFLPSKLGLDFSSITDWNTITTVPPDHVRQPVRSFNALMSSLLILTTAPQDPVLKLFSPTNVLGQIVLAHFTCVLFIIFPLSAPDNAMKTPMKAMIEWCERVIDAVKECEEGDGAEWTRFVQWPRKILDSMRRCLNQRSRLTFGDMYDLLVNNPRAFTEGTVNLTPK
ncbi:hypothetical protein K458DRAFT_123548 [Lentithecium fluviatile CBS 122367]|uniref:Zn(2)-C6 fungal-type domain-containing protein n=1 Tax=Lentithecium fluviatile CBS 122367 TaxID=1168545 RepID=A0A6G1JET2_9PLEO|nr:hypothetical protein K458DRAFT_123548 [Lentithecium fluviatile CBS 122367]